MKSKRTVIPHPFPHRAACRFSDVELYGDQWSKPSPIHKIEKWLVSNIGKEYEHWESQVHKTGWRFKNQEDAALFALVWG
jgi:hypothetical protein